MEIEAKLVPPDRAFLDRLARRRRLGPWTTEPRRPRRLESVYLDSRDGALGRERIGCRIRRRGASIEATVKSGGGVSGSVHRRYESTVPLARMPAFPWRLPRAIAKRVPAGLRSLELEPILHTSIRRRPLLVRREPAGPVLAEIALDEIAFRAPGQRGIRRELEIEVELVHGSARDLASIVRALGAKRRLRPSRGSKLERGLRWARSGRG